MKHTYTHSAVITQRPWSDVCSLTFDGVEEVEEGVVGDLLGDGAHSAAPFVLLFLLDGFHCHVLPLLPVYGTAMGRVTGSDRVHTSYTDTASLHWTTSFTH